jgi:hypothetical protein
VGANVQLQVTACNATGCSSALSNYTPAVTADSSTCTTTLNPSSSDTSPYPGNNVQQALANAHGGDVVCLNAGKYDTGSSVDLYNIQPSSNVTLQPTPGALVELGMLNMGDNMKNLTIKGFSLDGGVSSGTGAQSNVVYAGNIVDGNYAGGETGFYFYGEGKQQTGIQVIGNQMDNLCNGCSSATLGNTGAGQCITVAGGSGMEHNFTFSHNVCGPGNANHYTQYGGIDTVTEDWNTFLGPVSSVVFSQQEHNNVMQVFGGGNNIDFSNNYLWHVQSRAQDLLFQEGSFSSVTINNNLTVEDPTCNHGSLDCPSYAYGLCGSHGLTFTNNTVVDSAWGNLLTHSQNDQVGNCINPGTGTNYNVSHNLFVAPDGGQAAGGYTEITYAECSTGCTFDYNVTDDGTANQGGSTHYVTNWKSGFGDGSSGDGFRDWYQSPNGLPFQAGYQH